MEIQEILSFITVIEQKSFTKAANKLGYSKSSITIHIKNLESELNVQLIERLGKQITLTNQGETFYNDALKIIESIEEAKEHLSYNTELTGTLKLGTIDSLSTTKLPQLIQIFHHLYPHVKVMIITDTIQGLLNQLLSNDIDFAYLYDIPIMDYAFNHIRINESQCTFVTSKSNVLAQKEKITISDLQNHTLILTEKDASYRRVLDDLLIKNNLILTPAFEAQNTEIILKLLSRNMGISYLPAYVTKEHQDLVSLNSDFNTTMVEQIIYHKDKRITREMNEMIQLITKNEKGSI